jgi:hypothetical protein
MATAAVKQAIRKLFADTARSGAGKEAFQELGKIIKNPSRLWRILKEKGLIDDTVTMEDVQVDDWGKILGGGMDAPLKGGGRVRMI